jgi:hypothetical protein
MNRVLATNSALISVGANENQIPLIKKMKDLGYAVIGIDRNPRAPGTKYLDEHISLSTYESGPVIRELEKYKKTYSLKGVFTRSSGPPVITAAAIADYFDLPGATEKAASMLVNKSNLMKMCQLHVIANPQTVTIDNSSYFETISHRLPCVVKPALSIVGKKGVFLVRHEHEIDNAFHSAQSASYSGDVLVENFIPGNDVTLMSIVSQGKLYPVVMLRELNEFDSGGNIVTKGVSMPYNPPKNKAQLLYELAQSIVDASGVQNSPFLISSRYSDDSAPVPVEVHLDFGGDGILDELFPKSTDLDFIKYTLEIILGIKNPANPDKILFKPATITS